MRLSPRKRARGHNVHLLASFNVAHRVGHVFKFKVHVHVQLHERVFKFKAEGKHNPYIKSNVQVQCQCNALTALEKLKVLFAPLI